jgi:hypothetical protein
MAKTKQILDTYKNSSLSEKGAPNQKIDFIKTKIAGEIAVKGFTSKAIPGSSDYNLSDRVLQTARKGSVNPSPYSQSVKR